MSFDLVKLGRNELCPCDSGKKYKKCCLISPTYEGNEKKPEDRAATLLGRKRLLEKLKNENMVIASTVDSIPKISASILELAKNMLASEEAGKIRRIELTSPR